MIFVAVIGGIGSVLAVIFLVGLILHDIRSIKREEAYRLHPSARKWRWRPLISLYQTRHGLPPDFIQALRRIYRKLEITSSAATPQGELLLVLPRETQLDKDTLLAALRYFGESKTISTVELIPVISTPNTLTELLGNYRIILASMLMKSRLGLKIIPHRSLFPVLIKRQSIHQNYLQKLWHRTYSAANYLVAFSLPLILTYGLYLTLILSQTDLLLMIISGFGIFLVTAVWSYERLPISRRLGYTFLAPVSLGYFFVLAWMRPLKMLADMAKAKVPVGVSFLVRIKDILRII